MIDFLKRLLGIKKRFLCDTCRYDYERACHNPDRPNATECEEFKRK